MDLAAALRHAHPFRRAPDDALARLVAAATTRRIGRAEALWLAGDPSLFFTVLYSGLVKIVRPLASGREAILGLFGPRESVGDVAVLQGTPYPASAIVCSESSTVIRVPREVLTAQMQRSPGLAMGITSSMGDRIHSLHAKVEILSAGSVESRLAALLLDLAERFGDELDDGTVGIPIALSRQDLANLVSTTFETAIRVMSRWQKAGVLETRSDGFTLREVERLREAARSVAGPKGGGAGEAPG